MDRKIALLPIIGLLLAPGCGGGEPRGSGPNDEEAQVEVRASAARLAPHESVRMLDRLARSFYPRESGQFFLVQEDGAVFAHGGQRKIHFHATPWRYDTHVPLVLYSPSALGEPPSVKHDPVGPINIAATFFDLLSLPRGRWSTASALPVRFTGRPKILALVVLDMLAYDTYQSRLEAHPHFARLEREGIVFDRCDLDYLTTHTSISHAVLGTATYPNVHGVSTNFRLASRSPRVWKWANYFEDGDPSRLLQPTFADLHDAAVGNGAQVIGFSEHKKAIVPLTGHGTMHPGGDRDLVLFQDLHSGALQADAHQRPIPDYLADYSPERFIAELPESGLEVVGWPPRNYQELKAGPLCVDYRKRIIFAENYQSYEVNRFVAKLPARIKAKAQGNIVVVETPREFATWLRSGEDGLRQSWWQRLMVG